MKKELKPYTIIPLDNAKTYDIIKPAAYQGCLKRFQSTRKNLITFLAQGRPVSLVIPESHLSAEEMEAYRKFFCPKAKEDKMNYIYFEDVVEYKEVSPLYGTMFDE